MKKILLIPIVGLAMLGFSGCSDVAAPSSQSPAKYAYGSCKLTNLAANTVLYNGGCSIRQTRSGANDVIEVKMGNSQSFVFAGNGSNWMHGSDRVKYTDLGRGAIFAWDRFTLAVAADY